MTPTPRIACLVTTDSECSALYRARAMLGERGAGIRVLNLARSPLEPGSPPYKALLAEADLILSRWLGSRAAYGELLDALSASARAGEPPPLYRSKPCGGPMTTSPLAGSQISPNV